MIKLAQDNGLHLAANWAVNMSGKTFSDKSAIDNMVEENKELYRLLEYIEEDVRQGAYPNSDDPWYKQAKAALSRYKKDGKHNE